MSRTKGSKQSQETYDPQYDHFSYRHDSYATPFTSLQAHVHISSGPAIVLTGILRQYTCATGSKRDEVTGDWRKLHNDEVHNLYSSPNIMTMIKLRRMRWAGHLARIGEKRNAYRISVKRPKEERDH
jgi:hypothetical protein